MPARIRAFDSGNQAANRDTGVHRHLLPDGGLVGETTEASLGSEGWNAPTGGGWGEQVQVLDANGDPVPSVGWGTPSNPEEDWGYIGWDVDANGDPLRPELTSTWEPEDLSDSMTAIRLDPSPEDAQDSGDVGLVLSRSDPAARGRPDILSYLSVHIGGQASITPDGADTMTVCTQSA